LLGNQGNKGGKDMKKQKNLPQKGRLGKTKKGVQLVNISKDIIGNSSDPVKLLGDLIQYQRLVAKMYRENTRVK